MRGAGCSRLEMRADRLEMRCCGAPMLITFTNRGWQSLEAVDFGLCVHIFCVHKIACLYQPSFSKSVPNILMVFISDENADDV